MSQPHFQTVTVKEVSEEKLVLQLPDGATVEWPRAEGYLPDVQEGDELTLTLTHTQQLINDLLHSDHGNKKAN